MNVIEENKLLKSDKSAPFTNQQLEESITNIAPKINELVTQQRIEDLANTSHIIPTLDKVGNALLSANFDNSLQSGGTISFTVDQNQDWLVYNSNDKTITFSKPGLYLIQIGAKADPSGTTSWQMNETPTFAVEGYDQNENALITLTGVSFSNGEAKYLNGNFFHKFLGELNPNSELNISIHFKYYLINSFNNNFHVNLTITKVF